MPFEAQSWNNTVGENATTKTITMLAVSFKELSGQGDAGMMLWEVDVELYGTVYNMFHTKCIVHTIIYLFVWVTCEHQHCWK